MNEQPWVKGAEGEGGMTSSRKEKILVVAALLLVAAVGGCVHFIYWGAEDFKVFPPP